MTWGGAGIASGLRVAWGIGDTVVPTPGRCDEVNAGHSSTQLKGRKGIPRSIIHSLNTVSGAPAVCRVQPRVSTHPLN